LWLAEAIDELSGPIMTVLMRVDPSSIPMLV
jgi:hypothetical protein